MAMSALPRAGAPGDLTLGAGVSAFEGRGAVAVGSVGEGIDGVIGDRTAAFFSRKRFEGKGKCAEPVPVFPSFDRLLRKRS